MARIRSVHPGQWTAGDFLECAPLARLLALALRNVADDHGIFRWKPKSLKAECLPADNCDIDQLLSELISNDQVRKYIADGKEYGFIVDFTQWQRPKKPKYLHPVPDWFSTSTVPVETEEETASEILPQRKEEGGNDSGVETRASKSPKSLITEEAFALTSEILKSMGKAADDPMAVGGPYTVQHWLSEGMTRDAIMCGVATAMTHKKNDPPSSFKYFEKAVLRAYAELNRPLPRVEFQEAETIKVVGHGKPKSAIIQAADDLCRTIAGFDGPARGDNELRGPAREASPRLLSNG